MQKKIVKKYVLKKKIKSAINRLLVCILIVLSVAVISKKNPKVRNFLIKNVYEKNIAFQKIKQGYEKYFGNIFSSEKIVSKETPVFKEKITYFKKNTYKDGLKLTVTNNYMVPVLKSGIVVFIGKKDDYNNTVIVEQTDGIDVFYGNIDQTNIKLYDYVEKGSLLGQVKENTLYLVFQKDGKYLDYQKHI